PFQSLNRGRRRTAARSGVQSRAARWGANCRVISRQGEQEHADDVVGDVGADVVKQDQRQGGVAGAAVEIERAVGGGGGRQDAADDAVEVDVVEPVVGDEGAGGGEGGEEDLALALTDEPAGRDGVVGLGGERAGDQQVSGDRVVDDPI